MVCTGEFDGTVTADHSARAANRSANSTTKRLANRCLAYGTPTLALLEGGADIHTRSKQMGNSALMIERHYSKLTATMAADKLA